jgi:CDP-paratose 2-epimerase
MTCAVITGSGGLIGSEAARYFASRGVDVIGIDNNMRQYFFGVQASTRWRVEELERSCPRYRHCNFDIRDTEQIDKLFRSFGHAIGFIVHAAAQPSHDWAGQEPVTDFSINALGTLHLLEAVRRHCPEAAFAFLSTNKVYGDAPNELPLLEDKTRWEVADDHPYFIRGIDENMRIDQSTHSVFGASKAAADIMVQEYGRYFGLKTGCFRAGCLTGSGHSGAQLHGFLAYLMKCIVVGERYKVFGYKAKQVRDNIHSYDLVTALWSFCMRPTSGVVYNIGGSRFSNCSMLEAIKLCERVARRKLEWNYQEQNRLGDHIWWISDISRFRTDYPEWEYKYDLQAIVEDIHEYGSSRWLKEYA